MSRRPQRRRSPIAKRKPLRPRAAGSVRPPPPDWYVVSPFLREAGINVTPETAVQVSAVYGCCRLIVDSLAPAPITVTEVKDEGVREIQHDDPVSWILNFGASVRNAPDSLPAQSIEEALFWAALLGDGNGYAEIQRDGAGKLVALWPIESGRVIPRRDETGFYYEIHQPLGGIGRLEPINMFHLRGPSLSGWMGDSVVTRAAKAVAIAHASQVYSAAYFANGTVVSGLLTSDKNITPAQALESKNRWVEEHGKGPSKAHSISVLGSGVKYQSITHNAQEAMLVESRRFQVQEIARFYGVPTTLLADNEAWTNLSELYLGFYRNALRPWAERFDAEATRKLFPERQPWREVQHDLTHLTLGSFKDQVAALTMATGKPIWTQNEARTIFGKNPVEGGDELNPPAPEPSRVPVQVGDQGADPAEPDEDDAAQDEPVVENRISAREAIEAMFADAFGRHVRRARNRRADLKRELEARDHQSLRKALTEDCGTALALAKKGLPDGSSWEINLETYADSLDGGEPPEKAAGRIVTDLWRMA